MMTITKPSSNDPQARRRPQTRAPTQERHLDALRNSLPSRDVAERAGAAHAMPNPDDAAAVAVAVAAVAVAAVAGPTASAAAAGAVAVLPTAAATAQTTAAAAVTARPGACATVAGADVGHLTPARPVALEPTDRQTDRKTHGLSRGRPGPCLPVQPWPEP